MAEKKTPSKAEKSAAKKTGEGPAVVVPGSEPSPVTPKPNPNVTANDAALIRDQLQEELEAQAVDEEAKVASDDVEYQSKNYEKLHQLRIDMEVAQAKYEMAKKARTSVMAINSNVERETKMVQVDLDVNTAREELAEAQKAFEEAKRKG